MTKNKCYLCNSAGELRPYGKDMQWICYPCGMNPENIEETINQFYTQANAVKGTGVIGEETGPRPLNNDKGN